MTLGTWRGQGRKRERETRYPEPRRERKLTLLGLAFEDLLFHPEPAFLYFSLPAALIFSKQATKPVTSLGFAHAGPSAWDALPPSPSHSSKTGLPPLVAFQDCPAEGGISALGLWFCFTASMTVSSGLVA